MISSQKSAEKRAGPLSKYGCQLGGSRSGSGVDRGVDWALSGQNVAALGRRHGD